MTTRPWLLGLSAAVGNNRDNVPEDVLTVKRGLSQAGYFTMDQAPEPHGYITKAMDDGIRRFQKDNNLRVDGALLPGGETEQTLLVAQSLTPSGKGGSSAAESGNSSATATTTTPVPAQKPPLPKKTSEPILKGIDDEIVKGEILKDEDKVLYMYKDTAAGGGKVTVGVGHMIPNVEAAQELPFMTPDEKGSLRPATKEEIAQAYNKIKVLQQPGVGKKNTAAAYEPKIGGVARESGLDDLRLEPAAVDKLLTKRLQVDAEELSKKFPNFDTYSGARRQALLDMHFNLGGAKFQASNIVNYKETGWPKLFDAVLKGDWKKAAEESKRSGVSDERNEKTRQKLLDGLQ